MNTALYQSSTGPAPSPAGDTLATDGVATYRTLVTLPGFVHYRDYFTYSDWLYNSATGTFWSYDDPTSVTYKMSYAKLRAGGLAGAFMWALKDDDANATLFKTMANGLGVPKPLAFGRGRDLGTFGVPKGIRTPVIAVKGRCPRPG